MPSPQKSLQTWFATKSYPVLHLHSLPTKVSFFDRSHLTHTIEPETIDIYAILHPKGKLPQNYPTIVNGQEHDCLSDERTKPVLH